LDAALQAAQEGAGIALGAEPFFAEREAAGLLCRPLPIRQPGPTCWLVYRPADTRHPALQKFKQWLLAELRSGIGARLNDAHA
jgi:DNA-binding transcriptional LysR family regulator